MDILTNKTAKTSDYYSRYNGFYYYYNKLDNKNQMSTSRWLSRNNTYQTYIVQKGDTYDSIALWFYNNPTYYWIICDFNDIQNPFDEPIPNSFIKIPVLSSIRYHEVI
jgi:nucleoid-associated protein YgaU